MISYSHGYILAQLNRSTITINMGHGPSDWIASLLPYFILTLLSLLRPKLIWVLVCLLCEVVHHMILVYKNTRMNASDLSLLD